MIFYDMEGITLFKIYKYELLKLLGATMLFFLGLIIGVKQAGEPNTMLQSTFLQLTDSQASSQYPEKISSQQPAISLKQSQKMQEIVLTGSNKEEFLNPAPPTDEELFKEKCFINYPLCIKITYSGAISETEKLTILTTFMDTMNFLDRNIMRGTSPNNALEQLVINSSTGKRRGGATWKKITINLSSLGDFSEFYKVFVHELGHIVDLGCLQGLSSTKHGNFTEFGNVVFAIDDPSLEYYKYSRDSENIRSARADKRDFCSGYGMTNPFEDFAECMNLYLTNNQLFQSMAGTQAALNKKYNYFANLFARSYIEKGNQELFSSSWRPWDTTKI